MTDHDLDVKSHPALTGDAPKKLLSEDAFGLSATAQALARVVRNRVSANGYAIGIEGRWGSGKTTLLNFVEQLLTVDSGRGQKIIRFDPWLIGNKHSLLATFFEELAGRIDEFRSNAALRDKIGNSGKSALDRIHLNIQRYATYLGVAATTVTGASAFIPSLTVKAVGLILSALSNVRAGLGNLDRGLSGFSA